MSAGAGPRLVRRDEGSSLADGRRAFGCKACRRVLLFDAAPPPACPMCMAGELEPQAVLDRDAPPELIVPFARSREETREQLAAFCRSTPMRCSELDPGTLIERMIPVFQPWWLVDAQARGEIALEVGFDYQVESSQEVMIADRWQSRKVVRTKIRWEPRCGTVAREYLNVPSPAIGEHDALVGRIGAWDLKTAIKFTPDQIASVAVRAPEVDADVAWARAQKRLVELIGADAGRAASAQHARGTTVKADWGALHWTWLLAPMYVTWYRDSTGAVHPIWLHGQTGQPSGPRYASSIKAAIYAGIVACLALGTWFVAGLLLLAAIAFPPIAAAAVICALLGVPLAVGALVFPLRAWRHNRAEAARFPVPA